MRIEAQPSTLCLHLSDVYQNLQMESKCINSGIIKCSVLYHCRTNWRKKYVPYGSITDPAKVFHQMDLTRKPVHISGSKYTPSESGTQSHDFEGECKCLVCLEPLAWLYISCIFVFLMDKISNPMSCFVTGLWLFLALIHIQRDVTWCKGALVMFNHMFNHVLYFHTCLHKWEIGRYLDLIVNILK
jgi:hypothetical protein